MVTNPSADMSYLVKIYKQKYPGITNIYYLKKSRDIPENKQIFFNPRQLLRFLFIVSTNYTKHGGP